MDSRIPELFAINAFLDIQRFSAWKWAKLAPIYSQAAQALGVRSYFVVLLSIVILLLRAI